ncbi:aspartate--tRNA ligase, mitochondrial [Sitophilus oryzae]|uniref:Aspartate--tRNA ligase, mitochondrial n=1 Tax=Sitophilus oryzae TaxID=7048 RepID=A0A6J2XNY0_SITOR|nr:aspartate--tRNA ligase, mitochondrial [Sitophilus oryzae]
MFIKKFFSNKRFFSRSIFLFKHRNIMVPNFFRRNNKTSPFEFPKIQKYDFSMNNEYPITDENNIKDVYSVIPSINNYTNRTHTCGELRRHHVGKNVILYGWLEYKRLNKFIILRDSYGETQLIFSNEESNNDTLFEKVPYESILQVKGKVVPRPLSMINKNQKTGEIEVEVESYVLVNRANNNLPFYIREFQKAKESLRMQYRYLDIRFPEMQRNLRVRSKLLMRMREFLIHNHFVDVETPVLFKATPGGAQEFIVPTRFLGKFYSLTQSPQQFKQMLMAGALDRYFQIAKCYRDEGSRPDRQPEFTQLDIELSFTDVNGVIKLIEELLTYSLSGFCNNIPTEFPKIDYEEALENYGSDKPDITVDYKLQNCTDILKDNSKLNNTHDFGAYILIFNQNSSSKPYILPKQLVENNKRIASQFSEAKLIQSKIIRKEWPEKMSKLFTNYEAIRIIDKYNIDDNCIAFVTYGLKNEARTLLGKIRLEYINFLENELEIRNLRKKGFYFLWVLNFPLFELNKESGQLESVHHPFTAPHPEDIQFLKHNPLKVRGLAYDLILNGNEIGGGSIRIHDPMVQEEILDMLHIKRESLQHILEMLGSGCPPHGGIALGLDRFLSILLNTPSIRDVIAFPKTVEGRDPVSFAPSEVSDEILNMYHIRTNTKKL